MMRSLVVVVALATGIAAGAGATMVLQAEDPEPLAPIVTGLVEPEPGPQPTSTPTSIAPPAAPSADDVAPPPPAPQDQVLLVWTSGGLPDGFSDRVAAVDGVRAVTVVRADPGGLVQSWDGAGAVVDEPADGFVIPFEVMAFDPAGYRDFVPPADVSRFAELGPDEMLLGATSARLRRIGAGGVIRLADGATFTVAGVVDDVLIGAAEGAVSAEGAAAAGVTTERYLLARYAGPRDLVETAIREQLPPGTPARIRSPGETPVLRHGDAVLPQVTVKELFGEFAYRPGADREFTQDPDWIDANITAFEVPLLGTVRCHRSVATALQGALDELEQLNLGFLVDPAAFRGCHRPRLIDPSRGVSRHSWGVAIDLSFSADPDIRSAAQDPRLIEVMARWGFVSGHDWLVPDAGHFEYVRPPQP